MRLDGRMAGRAILLVLLLLPCAAPAITRYVDLYCPTPASPFTNWTSAATDIQSAISVCSSGDVVLVSNGVYSSGGAMVGDTLTNRVAITNAIIVRSVNGPASTYIVGGGSDVPMPYDGLRCAYLVAGAELSGFTLTNGRAHTSVLPTEDAKGGGVYCVGDAVISNCVITGCNAGENTGGGVYGGMVLDSVLEGNYAKYGGGGACTSRLERCSLSDNRTDLIGSGGGAMRCTVRNSTFSNNWASVGAAAWQCTIEECVITSNFTDQAGVLNACSVRSSLIVQNRGILYAGAAYGCTLWNCTIFSNSVENGSSGLPSGGAKNCTLINCILYQNKAAGTINDYTGGSVDHCLVGVDPMFVGADDFHLWSSSPGIDAGRNDSWMTSALDLDGVARILGGTVDIGCYEQARQASILPPAVTNPLSIQGGGSGLVRTTNASLLVQGVKPTGAWVFVQNTAGGYVSNDVVQTVAGSNWSLQLVWSWSSNPDVRHYAFSCSTNMQGTAVGTTVAAMRVTSAGFGVPSIELNDHQRVTSLDPGSISFEGIKGPHVVDTMWISNQLSAAVRWLPAPEYPASEWASHPPILAEGTNVLVVCGTNIFGDLACVTTAVYCVPRCDLVTVSGTTRTVLGGIPTNKVCRWQMSSDMQLTNWIDCSGVFTAETASVVLIDNGVTNSARFYRIVEVGP